MSAVEQNYNKVCEKLKELNALQGIAGLLGWDEMVMMPSGATNARGSQKSALTGVIHDKKSDTELGALLRSLEDHSSQLDPVQKAVVRDALKQYVKDTAVPKELAQQIAKLDGEAYAAWVQARQAADFSIFAPYLEQWVELSKRKAALIDASRPAYDVLLDDYEKGMTSARLDEVFSQVRDGLLPLIKELTTRGVAPEHEWLLGEYDVDKQAALCRQVALDIGFDLSSGRLDVSVHPFTGGAHPTDVRMTTRFKPNNLTEGLTGAIHETGHALYEQGRNLDYDGLPVNRALSMGVHESQSLLWERMVGLSPHFAAYVLPKIREAFPGFGTDKTAEDLYAALNRVRVPSRIRVESDEVTYPMHIIVRYEIERALMDGSLAVADVPSTWNSKMQEYLGYLPENDALGCLQDVHWSKGLFGYFPTYTLGAMYACQIFRHASSQIPDLSAMIAAGDFAPLKAWLNANIHKVGSLHASGDELMTALTGSPLDPSAFMTYIKDKYLALYKLQ